ncbi:MAG TPA: hypothetical protein VF766_04775 [Pyrinomonadaceae bacterium]
MSLTDGKDKELLAADFFKEVLVPLALSERAEGKSFFPLCADPDVESYYVEPTRRMMKASDFELRAAESLADFIKELAALWASEGHEELVTLAPRLLELAEEMGEEEIETEDVSAFMYVMF